MTLVVGIAAAAAVSSALAAGSPAAHKPGHPAHPAHPEHPMHPAHPEGPGHVLKPSGQLPVAQMEAALQAQGQYSNGVLSITVDRKDISGVTLSPPNGQPAVPVKPSWELHDDLNFESLPGGQAAFNGDLALKPTELDPVISAIDNNHLVFQAEHQHMYDFNPIVWFIHFRGTGTPVQLANEVHAVLKATSVPLPQAPPPNPTTPLDANRLKSILHGFSASVSSDGVVTVLVARRNPIDLGGFLALPGLNVATNVIFEPLNASGSDTAVMPDFSMVASEITPVVSTMQAQGWDIGCLYNQETAEQPQLYFSHEEKSGDPYQLAAEVRKGLDQTNSQ